MARGGTSSIAGNAGATNLVSVFDAATDGNANTIGVSNRASSAGPIYVYVPGLHLAEANAVPIAPGQGPVPFRVEGAGLAGAAPKVQIKGDGANAATVDYGVLA